MTAAFMAWAAPAPGQSMASWHAGRCAVCGIRPDYLKRQRLALDHDHDTGAVRGYLCVRCNRIEGTGNSVGSWPSWREGENPATLHGWSEPYVNVWGQTPVRDAVDEDELRNAIGRLSA